jgi:aminopeptidase N
LPDFHDYLESLMRGDMLEAESILMEREEFTFPTAKPQWAPPRDYNIEHLIMDWTVDLEEERVDAISKLKFSVITPEISKVFLHAAELNISSIRDSKDNELEWDMRPDEQVIFVYLVEPLKEGDQEELTFTYTIEHPRAGLFFTKPVPEHPDVEVSAWTQLQDDYARHIVPIYDNPSHKFSVEIILTVPAGFYAMSNGILKERKKNDDGTETFHWLNEKLMPAYLMMVWISEAVEYKDDVDGLEVRYYAHPKWDRDTVYRSYGKTPEMVKFFVEKLTPFPWDKYAQVTAALFVAGGMENVSATTQTDATFHDEKAHLDFESDGLVSHELAHSWGGDNVTCRTWSHGWLNEGWATQMQNEWKRHDKGDDEYFYEQYGKQKSYVEEDKQKYRRPIVWNEWERGMDMFDRHLYPGGAWRYYMLKHLVGEDRWWKILGEWQRRFAYKSVYTHDLEELFTQMTGEDYGWFFEQWLYKAGYPECKIKCKYQEKLGHVLVKIEQTQKYDDKITPKVFRFPLTIEFVDEEGERTRYNMEISERIHSFYYPVSEKPKQIIIDPDYTVLMEWDIDKPEPMWIDQLHHGTHVIQKIKAAQALGKKATPKALKALGKALVEENFWGLQLEIAKVLASVKNESALDQLLKGVDLKNTRARTGVATALGEFYKNDRALNALKKLLEDQESYFVAAAAAASLGKTQHDDAFDILVTGLKKATPSWHSIVQQGYLNGLAATEKKEVIDILKEYSKAGKPDELRRLVPGLLAKLGKRYKKEHPEIKSELEKLLEDRSFRVKLMTLIATKSYEDSALIPALRKIAETEALSGYVRRARETIRALSKKKEPEELDSMKKSIEELEKENRDLKDKVSKIEALLEEDRKKEEGD